MSLDLTQPRPVASDSLDAARKSVRAMVEQLSRDTGSTPRRPMR